MIKYILTICSLLLLLSCEEEPIGQQAIDNISPNVVTNVNVTNKAGSAVIHYDNPIDEDFLYVKAIYTRKGQELCESKSSLYCDSLVVNGFSDVQEKEVKLIAVDRSQNESEPTIVKINPKTPPYISIANSLKFKPDFGGVALSWDNEFAAKVAVSLWVQDSLSNEYSNIKTYYSDAASGELSVRGLDTKEKRIKCYILDRWENKSETVYDTISPFYETKFDRKLFTAVDLPGESPGVFGWVRPKLWDGIKGNGYNGYSSPGGSGVWPHSITIDLGKTGMLSRIRIYQRSQSFVFAEGNVRKFEVWGCETLDPSGDWDSWTMLGDFESIKPSGLPFGKVSNEDIYVANNGEDFTFSIDNPKVRYLRLKVKQTWSNGDNFQMCELEVFGDNRE
ncbi:DUF4959 domain-containing protein [Halosquirtibacter laminarini]|uniref:DUF4959 domain-containing protein n=1 Tax=Halosquirtibacter laminarini TaxID=3374600 RepID=A0AC61NIV0_9BACT|nr:DUF4959 domain-containing protein [Prolixibacteraceae bacterium]